jgi:hypothetical protein
VAYLPSFADFDFSFILFGAWFQLIGALASAAAGAYGASKSARVSQQNAREQRAWQTEMSNTAHTREIADLRNAGLNPILSSKNAGAPTGAGAMAQTPDFSKSYGSAVSNALMIAQTRKTNAEATIVEDRQNQAKLESELYGSAVGIVPVASKALKGLGSSAYSAYKGVRRYLNRPKSYKPRKGKHSKTKVNYHYSAKDKAEIRSMMESYKKPSQRRRRRGSQ